MSVVLVTGATGFLGSGVARALASRGESVRVLVRRTSDRRRIEGLALDVRIGDVTDAASVAEAARGARAIVHAAALYEFGTRDVDAMRRINVGGTENVLDAAAREGATVVHVSSVAALGPTEDAICDESHWSASPPRSAYEATKREAHEVVRARRREGARVRVVSPGTIYGPDDPSPVGLLHRLGARGLLRVGFLPRVRMSLVHVDDCVDAVLRVLDRAKDGDEHIAAASVVTFREWIDAIARATGRAPPALYLDGRFLDLGARAAERGAFLAGLSPAFVREALAMSRGVSWAFSGERARRELGWSPRSLDDGLRDTLRWYARRGA